MSSPGNVWLYCGNCLDAGLCTQVCMQVCARASGIANPESAVPCTYACRFAFCSCTSILVVCAQVLVTDTAGVRAADGVVEAEGVRRALAAAAAADIVAIVADAAAHPAVAAAAAAAEQQGRDDSLEALTGSQLTSRLGAAASEVGMGGAADAPLQQGGIARGSGRAQRFEARIKAACRGLFADFASAGVSAGSDPAAACGPGPPAGQPKPSASHPHMAEHAVPPAMSALRSSVLEVLLGADEQGVSMPAGDTDSGLGGTGAPVGCAPVPGQQVLLVANKWDLVRSGGGPMRAAVLPCIPDADLSGAPVSSDGRAEGDQARWRACAVSCRTGEGLGALLAELCSAVAAVAGGSRAADDAALVTRCAP